MDLPFVEVRQNENPFWLKILEVPGEVDHPVAGLAEERRHALDEFALLQIEESIVVIEHLLVIQLLLLLLPYKVVSNLDHFVAEVEVSVDKGIEAGNDSANYLFVSRLDTDQLLFLDEIDDRESIIISFAGIMLHQKY